ncbi:hypothetical protein B14911_16335 [Bacillus sp. NRRL B-14911]|uniref:Uncharacterized protein n=1 Tax=Bacillus infantis NRRL B-14911 TaxID=1367477 RepID=U5L800_9BACI|nr:hypothetical protein N288_04595 [Bacillus infantis NRRL B-14911]EAR67098.1 hypothetical protein B14911_16335 [Bacillus sp. NRRL B-14911]
MKSQGDRSLGFFLKLGHGVCPLGSQFGNAKNEVRAIEESSIYLIVYTLSEFIK